MISDAYVEVTCDGCNTVEIVQLTAIACRGWDERNVPDYLRRIGWTVNGDEHLCDECMKSIHSESKPKKGKANGTRPVHKRRGG